MRLPKIQNYKNEKDIEVVKLKDIDKATRDIILITEKEKVKFIKTAERIIRSSQEYKDYIAYLRTNIDMTECSFFKNINNKDYRKISIDIHHEPFTLFDITQAVLNKYLLTNKEVNYFKIAEEVMKLHYQGKVGLIPLSATVHQLVGEGKLFIPLQNVYGNFIEFLEEYEPFISEDVKDILQIKLKMSKELQEPDMTILEKKYVYLEVDGFSFPQVIEK